MSMYKRSIATIVAAALGLLWAAGLLHPPEMAQGLAPAGDGMAFAPPVPEAGQPFTVRVSAPTAYTYVDLAVDHPQQVQVVYGDTGWDDGEHWWEWTAQSDKPGTYTFTFSHSCPPGPGCIPVVERALVVSGPPTSTPTHTPTSTPEPTPTPTPTGQPVVRIPLYLPLVMRGYPPIHDLDDAPDGCPGLVVEVGHLYRDDFDRTNDNDWYTFWAAAGRTYTLGTFGLAGRADTLLELYGPNCATLLAENDDVDYPRDRASRIVWAAPAGGPYHAVVRNYDWRVHGADTGYTFGVTPGGALPPEE
jgi:hypothetical protein